MRTTLILFAILSIAVAVKWHQLHCYSFEDFKSEHGRNYRNAEEEEMRRGIFETELHRVRKHNADETKTWKEGINKFSDRTLEEKASMRGLDKSMLHDSKESDPVQYRRNSNFNINNLPFHVDWRQQGIVTPPKNQGNCGSCWTFATAESVESYLALATGVLDTLSEQQVLDCTPNPNQCGGTGGCAGGTVELAFAQITQSGGLSEEWTYSYQSFNGANFSCRPITPVVTVTNFTVLPSNEIQPMLEHIATVGPLAISVDASAWSAYESGVFNGCNQTNPDLDHAVQLVGYGTDISLGPYWLVRNSWSPFWGEEGYIRIMRESPDSVSCGLDIKPSDGDGCRNGPPVVKVCGTCGILYDSVYPEVQVVAQY